MNKRTFQIIAGVIALILSLLGGNTMLDQRQMIADLQSRLSAPDDTPAVIAQQGNHVQVVYKDRVVTRYTPVEGGVRLNAEKLRLIYASIDSLLRERANAEGHADTAAIDAGEAPNPSLTRSPALNEEIARLRAQIANPQQSGLLTVKTWGLCASPQLGGGWNGAWDGYGGMKVAYWNRLGVVLGATSHQIGGGISYKLDRIPLIHNTEVMMLYGVPFCKDYGNLYVGLGINL